MRSTNPIAALAALLSSSIMLYLGTGLHPIWWLVFLAPIPVLLVSERLGAFSAFCVAFAAWFLGGLNMWTYLHRVLHLPAGILVQAFTAPALFFALAVLLVRFLLRRGDLWMAALALPAFWVSYEYLTELSSPHSTFGNLAYTQMNFLPVIQIASVTGIWAISFCIFLFAATVAALFSRQGASRQKIVVGAVIGLFLAGVLLFGLWRLHSAPSQQRTVTALLVAKDIPPEAYPVTDQAAIPLLRQYADELRSSVPSGTDVTVLPEKIGRISEQAMPQVDQMFSQAAETTRSSIVVGLVRRTSSGDFNESRLYSPAGNLSAVYDKHHLIPGIEHERPGNYRTSIHFSSGVWGLTICKDMDFPKLSREYAEDGAALLLVPAWDFNIDGWLHGRMAVLRGVEDGFSIARSAKNGVLTVTDNRGRVLAETRSSTTPFASVKATFPVAHESTVYTRFGDWFARINVVLFICLLSVSIWRSLRFSRRGVRSAARSSAGLP